MSPMDRSITLCYFPAPIILPDDGPMRPDRDTDGALRGHGSRGLLMDNRSEATPCGVVIELEHDNSGRPLDGITVIALEQAVAAPFATRQLADLGARVIKIERPDGGDFARHYDRTVSGQSSYFVWLNRSKESLTLDLKRPEVAHVLSRLLTRADVFVQNLAPGAAGRLGAAPSALRARHPRLIVCSVSGYGSSGPYAGKKAY